EAAREFGVGVSQAQLAKLREYTEPFRILSDSVAMQSRLFRALRRRGLRCSRTNTHHIATATPDRAEGLRTLAALWREEWGDHMIVGLGASEDDVWWLRHVHVPVIVVADGNGLPARALSRLPTAQIAKGTGRHGWSEAVIDVVGRLLATPAGR